MIHKSGKFLQLQKNANIIILCKIFHWKALIQKVFFIMHCDCKKLRSKMNFFPFEFLADFLYYLHVNITALLRFISNQRLIAKLNRIYCK